MKLIHSVCLPHETNFPKLKAEQELVLENAPPNIAKPSLSSQKIENAPSESHLLSKRMADGSKRVRVPHTLSQQFVSGRSCSRSYSGTDSTAVSILGAGFGLLGSGFVEFRSARVWFTDARVSGFWLLCCSWLLGSGCRLWCSSCAGFGCYRCWVAGYAWYAHLFGNLLLEACWLCLFGLFLFFVSVRVGCCLLLQCIMVGYF